MASRFFVLGTLAVLATLTASSAVVALPLDGVSYEIPAPRFSTTASSGSMAGERLLNFDTSGATDTPELSVSVPPIPPGHSITLLVEWDQAVTGATSANASATGARSGVDVCVSGATGSTVITDYDGNPVSCTGASAVGVNSEQILIIGNPANAAGNTAHQTLKVMVGLASNALGTSVPGRMLVSVRDEGLGVSATAAAAVPAAPTLTLGAKSVPQQTTVTLTWSSVNASDCIASGNANAAQTGWQGTLSTTGSYTVTPINIGTYTYSLACANSAGTSPTTTATLTVTASAFTGNYGALDLWSLLGLGGCVVLLRLRKLRGLDRDAPPGA